MYFIDYNRAMKQNTYDNIKVALQENTLLKQSLTSYKGSLLKPKPYLYDIIMRQVELSPFHPDKEICAYLLLQLDERGFFKHDFKTIVKDGKYPAQAIKKTIALLRTFTPHGLFSFSIKECLQIQCKLAKTPTADIAFLLCGYIDELRLEKYAFLRRKCKIKQAQLLDAIDFLKQLDTAPASPYIVQHVDQIIDFKIELQDEILHLYYLDATQTYTSIPIQEIDHTSKIKYRKQPICLIMMYLCYYQSDFFKSGQVHYLTLDMISKAIGLHSSTISKQLHNKTFLFNQKQYALKTLMNATGTKQYSAQMIKQYIIDYIQKEDKTNPYSDAMIQQMLLHDYQIHIARRTVVKYRESCLLFNSKKRKIEKVV